MTNWVTSDLHFGQKSAPSHGRPQFADVGEMNEALIDNWNALVKPVDIVYIVGDLCMGSLPATLPLVSRLAGIKVLIPGNHDRMWGVAECGLSYETWVTKYRDLAGVETEAKKITCKLAGNRVTMCHFPRRGYTDERHDQRYLNLYPEDDGGWLLHGHTHNVNRISGERSIHVGVDAWDYRPVHEDEIASIIVGLDEIAAIVSDGPFR